MLNVPAGAKVSIDVSVDVVAPMAETWRTIPIRCRAYTSPGKRQKKNVPARQQCHRIAHLRSTKTRQKDCDARSA